MPKTMKMIVYVMLWCCLSLGVLFQGHAWSKGVSQRLEDAFTVLKEIQRMPEKGIPHGLLKDCVAIAVFPSVYKGGFVVGGSYGKGVLFARDKDKNRWNGPVFLTIGAGSLGWQIGVKATDLVLVIMNSRGLAPFFKGNFTLGGEVGISAGPVGRELDASTDVTLKSEIYSYSRSKGFFAGLSLEGAYIKHDYSAIEEFWKRPYTAREILSGRVRTKAPEARAIIGYLEKITR